MIIEAALDKTRVADNGWSGSVVRRLDTKLWTDDTSQWTKGLLTKLHGSVNWTRSDSEIYISGPLFTGKHEAHVILYPGFKGRPTEPTFLAFHNHLRRCLETASVAIFIGFAFRDEYINEICERSLTETTDAIIINPLNVDVPLNSKQYRHIQSSFDIESVSEVLQYVRRKGAA